MTKKETMEMLREMLTDLYKIKDRSWWQEKEMETLSSAINFLEGIKK